MAGYRLELMSVACVGALACGPKMDEPMSDEGNASASASSGYPLDSSGSPTSADESSDTTQSECSFRGEICGELSVCQCDCDYGGCCDCQAAECTSDAHCDGGEVCIDVSNDNFSVSLECVPEECRSLPEATVQSNDDAATYEGLACLGSLSLTGPSLTDISALANLTSIASGLTIDGTGLTTLAGLDSLTEVGTLNVTNNAELASIDALGGLWSIRSGASIRDNPMLPAAEVHELLLMLENLGGLGGVVEVCGNLDDVPCP